MQKDKKKEALATHKPKRSAESQLQLGNKKPKTNQDDFIINFTKRLKLEKVEHKFLFANNKNAFRKLCRYESQNLTDKIISILHSNKVNQLSSTFFTTMLTSTNFVANFIATDNDFIIKVINSPIVKSITGMQNNRGLIDQEEFKRFTEMCISNNTLDQGIARSISVMQHGKGMIAQDDFNKLTQLCTFNNKLDKEALKAFSNLRNSKAMPQEYEEDYKFMSSLTLNPQEDNSKILDKIKERKKSLKSPKNNKPNKTKESDEKESSEFKDKDRRKSPKAKKAQKENNESKEQEPRKEAWLDDKCAISSTNALAPENGGLSPLTSSDLESLDGTSFEEEIDDFFETSNTPAPSLSSASSISISPIKKSRPNQALQ
jgi:hypothetical protein